MFGTKISLPMRLGMMVLGLFVLSAFKSCQELKYSLSGKSVATEVAKVTEQRDRYGTLTGYNVWYAVPGANMNGFTLVGVGELPNYPLGRPIQVEFINPGTPYFDERIKGTAGHFWVGMFFLFLSLLVGGTVWGFIHAWRIQQNDKLPRHRR